MTDGNLMVPKRIMIVDDEEEVSEVLEAILISLGYLIFGVVRDGQSAIDLIKDSSPDCVLMDINLDGSLDGIETAQQIHKFIDVPIVFITAYASADKLERAKTVAPYGYLVKPVSREELKATVEIAFHRHQASRRIQDLNIQLQQEIETRKQTEEELKIAKEQAEAASLAKSRLLANMSHEIYTPLNAIMGYSQILLNESSQFECPSTVKRHLETIKISGKELSEVIDNMLALAKMEAGHMSVVKEEIDLKRLVQGIYHLHKSQALQKKMDFTYEFIPKTPEVIYSDRTKINQILKILVENAINFTPEGKAVTLRALTEKISPELPLRKKGEEVFLFQVIDEGIGIPQEHQEKIFGVFEQVDDSMKRLLQGVGLGLGLAKKMVELLGGNIEVNSAPGEGSTFTVKLPATTSASIHSSIPETSPIVEDSSHSFQFAKDNVILVVDDSLINREMIKVLFDDLGLSIHMAEDGAEGIKKTLELQEKGHLEGRLSPDLILMDMHMPKMDGMETIRQIRLYPQCADIPIVVLSADTLLQQEIISNPGISGYLKKPLELDKIIPLLTQYLHQENRSPQRTDKRTALPTLPEDIQHQLEEQFHLLSQIPFFKMEQVFDHIEKMLALCEPFESPYSERLEAIEHTLLDGDKEYYDRLINEDI